MKTESVHRILFADGNRGIYIPQHFAQSLDRGAVEVTGMDQDSFESAMTALLSGPDHDLYWDCWDEIERNVELREISTGITYSLHLDGDLWLLDVDADPRDVLDD